jgi:hypothetical protein
MGMNWRSSIALSWRTSAGRELGVIFRKGAEQDQDPAKLRRLVEHIDRRPGLVRCGYQATSRRHSEKRETQTARAIFYSSPLSRRWSVHPSRTWADPLTLAALASSSTHDFISDEENYKPTRPKSSSKNTCWDRVVVSGRLSIMNLPARDQRGGGLPHHCERFLITDLGCADLVRRRWKKFYLPSSAAWESGSRSLTMNARIFGPPPATNN